MAARLVPRPFAPDLDRAAEPVHPLAHSGEADAGLRALAKLRLVEADAVVANRQPDRGRVLTSSPTTTLRRARVAMDVRQRLLADPEQSDRGLVVDQFGALADPDV